MITTGKCINNSLLVKGWYIPSWVDIDGHIEFLADDIEQSLKILYGNILVFLEREYLLNEFLNYLYRRST